MYTARQPGQTRRWPYALGVIILLAAYGGWTLGRALPAVQPVINQSALQAKASAGSLQWPAQGQAAVGVAGSSILETHGQQQPSPTASTAKLITALTVLAAKPLSTGQSGPSIALNSSDVAIYNNYVAEDGSLVRVQNGEQISEYQMLQAMLLPSANNMADSLAIWAFGSLKDYHQAANQYLEDKGLVETHVGSDASGFNPSTTSTARDLVRIGELVMQNPVLAQIVGQPSASDIPVAGNIKNVNSLLGTDGIIGIKTGNTDQAGGVFVSASRITVNNKPVIIVTALAGAPGLWQAMNSSLPLIKSAQANFKPVTAVKKGAGVAVYGVPWGKPVAATAAQNLSLDAWGGSKVSTQVHLQNITTKNHAGQTIGSVTTPKSASNNRLSIPIKLQTTLSKPSTWWRLTHPF
ncbi:MAG TPA: serine hydrolase [Candidatus Saccharimonadales bacterium]|nr:serine hydrolase [Candidatus Saccharimonadales bacterium]